MSTDSVAQDNGIASGSGTRIPLIHRLFTLLVELDQRADGVLFVSHRPLATRLDCSPGILPRLMRQLEAAGQITRTRVGNTYAVQVIGAPAAVRSPVVRPNADRTALIANDRRGSIVIDRDRSGVIDCDRGLDATPQQDAAHTAGDQYRSESIIPPTPPLESSMHEHACMQQARAPIADGLTAFERAGFVSVRDQLPSYTLALFEADVRTVMRRDNLPRANAVRIVIKARRAGAEIYSEPVPPPTPRPRTRAPADDGGVQIGPIDLYAGLTADQITQIERDLAASYG